MYVIQVLCSHHVIGRIDAKLADCMWADNGNYNGMWWHVILFEVAVKIFQNIIK